MCIFYSYFQIEIEICELIIQETESIYLRWVIVIFTAVWGTAGRKHQNSRATSRYREWTPTSQGSHWYQQQKGELHSSINRGSVELVCMSKDPWKIME